LHTSTIRVLKVECSDHSASSRLLYRIFTVEFVGSQEEKQNDIKIKKYNIQY